MRLTQIRDECFSASAFAHERIRQEWRIYHNEDYGAEEMLLSNLRPRVSHSLNPQIRKGVMRLISPFKQQAARMQVEPDRSSQMQEDIVYVKDLQNWMQMMEEADNESESLETSIHHNLISGIAFRKQFYDTRTKIFRSESVHPLNIAVDGEASRIDFSDAYAVCQKYWRDEYYLKRHYDWTPPKRDANTKMTRKSPNRFGKPTHRLDEIWMRRDLAEDCVEIDKAALEDTDKQMFRAILIDDHVIEIKATPYWWPDFPYAAWRNFQSSFETGKAQDFWGFGFGTLMWPEQKFLDELIAAIVAFARNTPQGQAIITKGALDPEQPKNLDGQIIELQKSKEIGKDFQKLQPEQLQPVFSELIQYMQAGMQESMPSLSPVFTGEATGANESGRAVNSRQWAAYTQLDANITRMNVFRTMCAVQRLTGIQQTAKRPLAPHLWRRGLDLPNPFPEEARRVGFQVVSPDTASMPHSTEGKMQVIEMMAALGYIMPLDDLLEFTGFDKGYGLTPDMFEQMIPMGPQGAQGAQGQPQGRNADIMMGVEAPMP